jgi:hypothetical protein
MDEPRRANSSTRPLTIGVLVVVVAAAAFGGGLLIAHRRKKSSTTTTTVAAAPGTGGPITFPTFASKMGLSTGVQLWNASPAKQDAQIAGIASAGAHWLRTALLWRTVERQSADQDDWSRPDHIIDDAVQHHLSVILDIGGAPQWAGAAQSGEYSTDPQQYADFCAKVATRYAGRVRVFELGNEPNLTSEIPHPDPATYAKILRATYPAIKKADPNAFVLTAGLGGNRHQGGNIAGADFLTGLYQDGAKGFFDGMAYHPYTYPLLPTQDVDNGTRNWAQMLRIRSLMVSNGDGNKPIWITEFGAPTGGPGGVSDQQQAAILQNGFDLWKTYSWGGVISWFDYADKGTDQSSNKNFFGIVDGSGGHKPSWTTYSQLAH